MHTLTHIHTYMHARKGADERAHTHTHTHTHTNTNTALFAGAARAGKGGVKREREEDGRDAGQGAGGEPEATGGERRPALGDKEAVAGEHRHRQRPKRIRLGVGQNCIICCHWHRKPFCLCSSCSFEMMFMLASKLLL